ncbi:hypothetical protein QUA42_07030 [Microcoleus sp. Pol11C2]|uniref:hypothetical protein n=1 Tax=Microcoleus sp. Pol11C2 TaxID=3055389 RepID=UPI002FD6CA52
MSFEFESVNQFSAELEQDSTMQKQQSPAHSVAEELNSVAQELNDKELDVIAGGVFGGFQYNSNIPHFSEAMQSYYGQKK